MTIRLPRLPLSRAALVGCVLLAGCSFLAPPPQVRGNRVDADQLKELVPGTTTEAEARSLLGSPTAHATFDDNTWLYISEHTQPASADPGRAEPGRRGTEIQRQRRAGARANPGQGQFAAGAGDRAHHAVAGHKRFVLPAAVRQYRSVQRRRAAARRVQARAAAAHRRPTSPYHDTEGVPLCRSKANASPNGSPVPASPAGATQNA